MTKPVAAPRPLSAPPRNVPLVTNATAFGAWRRWTRYRPARGWSAGRAGASSQPSTAERDSSSQSPRTAKTIPVTAPPRTIRVPRKAAIVASSGDQRLRTNQSTSGCTAAARMSATIAAITTRPTRARSHSRPPTTAATSRTCAQRVAISPSESVQGPADPALPGVACRSAEAGCEEGDVDMPGDYAPNMSPDRSSVDHAAATFNPAAVPLDRVRVAVEAEERRRARASSQWFATDRGDRAQCRARALAGAPSVIVVAGGDGTVRVVAGAALGERDPDRTAAVRDGETCWRATWACHRGSPRSVAAAALGGETRPVDVGVAEIQDEEGTWSTRVFLVMAGIGLDAEMAHPRALWRSGSSAGWPTPPIARSLANRALGLTYRIDGGRTRRRAPTR